MQKIIDFIAEKGQATVTELSRHLGISRQAIHRQLNNLLKANRLIKIGKPPKVFYRLRDEEKTKEKIKEKDMVPEEFAAIINNNFLTITPSGERKEGMDGFAYWCTKRKLPIGKTAAEYARTLKKYSPYKKDGLIDDMYKMKKTFNTVYLDKLFYLDFYDIERFGKTKLGQLLLYAKQSQNRALMSELVDTIRPEVLAAIKKYGVDAVGFIPPTVRREVQLMRELERQLNLALPKISLVKVKTPVAVPQKTLTKLEDRIENARDTIVVDETRQYGIVLLIDDALGSGATLNETAKKLKGQKLAQTVIGLAITGSFSGFEVISEV